MLYRKKRLDRYSKLLVITDAWFAVATEAQLVELRFRAGKLSIEAQSDADIMKLEGFDAIADRLYAIYEKCNEYLA